MRFPIHLVPYAMVDATPLSSEIIFIDIQGSSIFLEIQNSFSRN